MKPTYLSLWHGEVSPVPTPRATINLILSDVAWRHGVSVEDILGHRRPKKIVHARQEAMWRLRQECFADGKPRYSLPRLGEIFGRDHTTILHGCRAHSARMEDQRSAA